VLPKKLFKFAAAPAVLIVIAFFWGCGSQDPDGASDTTQESDATSTAVVQPGETAPPSAPSAASSEQPRIVVAQADSAQSRRFSVGTHYERLSPTQPTSSSPEQIEVTEIFWYGCPHCYTFDPYLESWKENLPGDVSFVRIPAMWNDLLKIHAQAFYTAQVLNLAEEMHTPLFREIHVNGNALNTKPALQEFFSRFGVDAESFDNAFESFTVFKSMQDADNLSRRYRVSSVPAVVVNGKYTTNATIAGSYPNLLEVIDELVAMERAGE
jgi:thiol:disulfide interchange protein DsbA